MLGPPNLKITQATWAFAFVRRPGNAHHLMSSYSASSAFYRLGKHCDCMLVPPTRRVPNRFSRQKTWGGFSSRARGPLACEIENGPRSAQVVLRTPGDVGSLVGPFSAGPRPSDQVLRPAKAHTIGAMAQDLIDALRSRVAAYHLGDRDAVLADRAPVEAGELLRRSTTDDGGIPLGVAEVVAWVRYMRFAELPADQGRADLQAALDLFGAIAQLDRSLVPADIL
jgi:hypothetical protein